jgi:hypothetical protein
VLQALYIPSDDTKGKPCIRSAELSSTGKQGAAHQGLLGRHTQHKTGGSSLCRRNCGAVDVCKPLVVRGEVSGHGLRLSGPWIMGTAFHKGLADLKFVERITVPAQAHCTRLKVVPARGVCASTLDAGWRDGMPESHTYR